MKVMTPGSIPLFLATSTIGEGGGCMETAPQIISFDVYYDSPLVVGFHVMDSSNTCSQDEEN